MPRRKKDEAILAPGTVYHPGSEKCSASIQFFPYFAARDKSITRWYIAARVYEDIKIV